MPGRLVPDANNETRSCSCNSKADFKSQQTFGPYDRFVGAQLTARPSFGWAGSSRLGNRMLHPRLAAAT
jgi:hypothetical protein